MDRRARRLGLGLILAALAGGGCAQSDGGAGPAAGGSGGGQGGSAPRADARSGTGGGGGSATAGTGGTPVEPGGTGGGASPADGAGGTGATADAAPAPADGSVADSLPADVTTDTGPAMLPQFPLAQVRAARKERLVQVGAHVEGPTWRDGDLFFAQDGGGLMKLNAAGQVSRVRPDFQPIGSFLLADGSMLWCDHQNLLVQLFADGRAGALVNGGLAPKCNDMTVDAEGNIFFSDYTDSIYRVTPAGEFTRALGGLAKPNGVEVDPESKNIYIVTGGRLLRSTLSPGGLVGPAQLVVTLGGGNGDGLAFDQWGNLWVAVFQSGAAVIVDPRAKTVLGNLDFGGAGPTNLTFGGPQRDQLYVTIANSGIWRAHVGVTGFKGHPGAPTYVVKRMLPTR